jgi:ammonium transporter Rh
MGAICDLIIWPGSAIGIGALAGILSVAGYVYVQPFLERKIGLHDTCGINNLHGMPSLLSGFAAVIAASQATPEAYGTEQLAFIYKKRFNLETQMLDRSANQQAAYHFAFMVITMAIGTCLYLCVCVCVCCLLSCYLLALFFDV